MPRTGHTVSHKSARIPNIKSLARQWTEAAINTLGGIATHGGSETARVMASIALLDRGWGKPNQPLTADDDGGPLVVEVVYRYRDKPDQKLIEGTVVNGKE